MRPVAVALEMVTAYGWGIDATWNGLLSGKSALAVSDRIPHGSDPSSPRYPVGAIPGITKDRSTVMQLIEPLLSAIKHQVPSGTLVLLATTTGEIELLEGAVAAGEPVSSAGQSDPSHLLPKVCKCLGDVKPGYVISAACASSTIAVGTASSLIRSGQHKAVLVVACDALSEFVHAGFATMRALAPVGAQPFDENRQGLSLGEAAAAMLLMDPVEAKRQGRSILGEIAGASTTTDAFHVTRPDATGAQLARACDQAMKQAGCPVEDIAFICAHGTGTRHNDAMEMAAFTSMMTPRPLFSVKGGLGHTLGAAGLIEIALSFRALAEGTVPPTVNFVKADASAEGWVSSRAIRLSPPPRAALTTNCGFGGINAAMILSLPR